MASSIETTSQIIIIWQNLEFAARGLMNNLIEFIFSWLLCELPTVFFYLLWANNKNQLFNTSVYREALATLFAVDVIYFAYFYACFEMKTVERLLLRILGTVPMYIFLLNTHFFTLICPFLQFLLPHLSFGFLHPSPIAKMVTLLSTFLCVTLIWLFKGMVATPFFNFEVCENLEKFQQLWPGQTKISRCGC